MRDWYTFGQLTLLFSLCLGFALCRKELFLLTSTNM